MQTRSGSPVLRRILGKRLRRLRETAGHALQSAAPRLDWSVSTLSRIETARQRAEVPDGVEVVEVVRERSWVLLPGDHPLAIAPTVSLADLAGSAWVSRPEAGLLRRLRQDCRRVGFEPDIQFRSVDTVAMMAVIESGAAVGLASPLGDRSGSVVLRPCPDTGEYAWILAHRPGTLPADMIRTVWGLIRWAYRFRAQQNPELVAMLPPEIRDAALPAPFTS